MADSPSRIPLLSVVIATYNAQDTIEACLHSLENQTLDDDYEIIVVDSSTDNTARIIKERFPSIKLHQFSERKFCGDARNYGISQSTGQIVAFIDGDCVAETNWIESIIRAHQHSYMIIAGSIANRVPSNIVGWAAYFCEFSQWMPGSGSHEIADAAGANVSYQKQLFSQAGHFIERTYCSDTDFHWRVRRLGHPIQLVPDVKVQHTSINRFSIFITHEFMHGRSFAIMRIGTQSFTWIKRIIYTCFSFLIPFWLLIKITTRVMQRRMYILTFMRSLPLLILGLSAWSAGECIGYIRGTIDKKNSQRD